jgi:hypothetical protein
MIARVQLKKSLIVGVKGLGAKMNHYLQTASRKVTLILTLRSISAVQGIDEVVGELVRELQFRSCEPLLLYAGS